MALRALVDKLTLPELGASLRQWSAASAQRQLLSSIDTTLALHGDLLVNCANGETRRLSADGEPELARRLARAARSLLPKREQAPHILLLLPPSHFIATRFKLALQGESLLRSALSLQAPSLLPAFDEALLLAVSGQRGEGVALWYPAAQASALYQAFAGEGLQLVALQPRVLAAAATLPDASGLLLDEDAQQLTLVQVQDGVVRAWHAMHRRDLADPELKSQWEAELAALGSDSPLPDAAAAQPAAVIQPLAQSWWTALRQEPAALPGYAFHPAGALERGRQLLAQQQRRRLALAAGVVVGLLILPFVSNALRIALLQREVAALQEASSEARRSQSAVYQLEEVWGPLADYPRQDVGSLLLTLNGLMEHSLTSFTLNKGVVDISGYAADPALLIEQLAELEQFHGVGQSRGTSGGGNATRGDRFGIRMQVSGVDFPAYESRYVFRQN
jgi:hypothetical protein